MTTARAMTLGAIVVTAVLVAILLLGGNGAHRYKLIFQTAGQLVNDNDVQVGGRRVGSVKDIQLTANNQAEITIEVDKPYAPLHEGTTAVIRATSLSGVANRYIALSPGPDNAPKLADGAVLDADKTTTIVDLDQLFNTLDAPTRKGLADTIQGFATWYAGKGLQANAAGRYFPPALSSTRNVLEKLNADQVALNTLVQDTSQVVTTLARKAPTLTDLVSNADTTFGAIASENASLSQALSLLPQTLRRAQHDVRRPAPGARRRRQARRGLQARLEEPRTVPGDAASAADRGAADDQPARQAGAPARAPATTSQTS